MLALGGGAVLSDAVREALKRLPHVVWLDGAARGTLGARRRRRAGGAGRSPPTRRRSRALLADREPLYREVATEVVETGGRSPAAVAAAVAAASRQAPAPPRPRAGGGAR